MIINALIEQQVNPVEIKPPAPVPAPPPEPPRVETEKKLGRGFVKGDPRINRAGAIYKVNRDAAAKKMIELGFEPISEMIKLIMSARSEKVKQEGIAWLGDKVYPSLKAVEHAGDKDAPVVMQFNLPGIVKQKD